MVFPASESDSKDMRQPILTSIESLREEKASLEEEIRQLRAAVQMYTAVARELADRACREHARDGGRPRLVAAAA